jgi:predicted TPR repeat methyltransferase
MLAEGFERLYARSPDPWNYCTSEYEREKYAATLAALPQPAYKLAVEIGCSIGAFTEMLAPRCEWLLAADFSQRALQLARERLAVLENVELLAVSFPEEMPPGSWDLVVCSEVLYYLDRPALEDAIGYFEAQLSRSMTVLVVSWRGGAQTEPLTGD